VPRTEATERTGVTAARPLSEEEEAAQPVVSVRTPAGSIPNFDEIVTPHPMVAFLFRRRTFIVLIAVVVLTFWARPDLEMLLAGIALAAAAEAWRIWAAGTIHKTEELTTGGPYAHVRHPLYVGSFVHALAYCFMSGQWHSFLWVPPVFFLVYGAAVFTEEAMLHKIFGEKYAAYCERVPRFLPRLRPAGRGHGQFSWRQVLENKEYVNVIWVAVLSSLFVLRLFWKG
jgi:protein-S-isoprenylcysteine O-methyltransferase Ste14